MIWYETAEPSWYMGGFCEVCGDVEHTRLYFQRVFDIAGIDGETMMNPRTIYGHRRCLQQREGVR